MTLQNNIALKGKLESLGFGEVVNEINSGNTNDLENFTIFHYRGIARDQLMYGLEIKKNQQNEFTLYKYVLGIRRIPIPETIIAGINTKELEAKMIKADELYNQYLSGNEDTSQNYIIKEADDTLIKLLNSGEAGKELAQLIMFKYWPEDQWERFIPDAATLRDNYETKLIVTSEDGTILSAMEAYEKIKEAFSIPTIDGMFKEHVISDEAIGWVQFELANNRNWIAYNTIPYFLEKEDMQFFKIKDEANEFADNNISEFDDFKVIYAHSFRDVLLQIPYGIKSENELNNLITKNVSIMNNENFQYLSDNLKYMGFGENLKPELEKNLGEGKAEFQLQYKAEINKKPFEVTMNFRKSDSSDMYFFNNYHASLERNNGEKAEQTFYLNKGKGVTGKEAFNLLDGRAVHKDLVTKEGQPYKAWIQLDFENKDKNNNFEVKQYHENYGYDLKAAVEKLAVAELKDPEKEKSLMQSLQKGNVQSITIEKDGNSHKMFMEADPQYKKVTLYDSNMKMVAKESLEQYKTGIDKGGKAMEKEQEPDKKKDLKQEAKPEKEKLEKKNGQSLLPKKRESKGKGLGVS